MSRWLRCRTPRPDARVRLVCLPHAGGTAGFFSRWSPAVAPDVEVTAVQYPGREDRIEEPPIDDMEGLARVVADELDGVPGPPVALFGHSMGAAVAYEVARMLDVPPVHLFVSGRHAPSDVVPGEVHLRDDDGLVADLCRLGGTDAELLAMPELRSVVLPAVRNDYRLAETYRELPGPRLTIPLTAFVGTADPEVSPAQAARWAAHTTGPFRLTEFDGDHFYLVPRRASVVDAVGTALERVPAGGVTNY